MHFTLGMNMKKLILTGLLSCVGAVSLASWDVVIEDDIFAGKKAMLVGALSSNDTLVFDCQKDKPPKMFLIYPDKTTEYNYPLNVKFLIKIDDNEVIQGFGGVERRNPDYGAFTYSANNELQILKELRDAKRQILIGIQFNGNQNSISGDVFRSTSSVNSFLKACDLNL